MTQAIVRVADETTRDELAEALTNLVHAARREFPVVGTYLAPTPWDRRHEAINALLTDYEVASA